MEKDSISPSNIQQKPKLSPEEKKKYLEQQHNWYLTRDYVLYEMVKELKNRSITFLANKLEEIKQANTHLFYASSIYYLKEHLDVERITRGDILKNCYRTVTLFKENAVPTITYKSHGRKDLPEYVQFFKEWSSNAVGYDFVLDIDINEKDKTLVENGMTAYAISKKIKELFDSYYLPYYVKWSGRKGFHFIIPTQYSPSMSALELTKLYKDTAINLSNIVNIQEQGIDIGIYDFQRVIKIAYSYDSGNISLPLDDTQFNNFSMEMVKFENVSNPSSPYGVRIFKRGLLLRDSAYWNLTELQLRDNFKRFLNDYSGHKIL